MAAKNDFKPDTRYSIAWRDPQGRVRPANVYVFRVYEQFLVVRMAGDDGRLRKITYAEVARIVAAGEVPPQARYAVPAPVLDEHTWRDRTVMDHYATSPALGK